MIRLLPICPFTPETCHVFEYSANGIGEVVDFYEKNPVSSNTPNHIVKGFSMSKKALELVNDRAHVNASLMKEYDVFPNLSDEQVRATSSALKEVAPFNFSPEIKNGLIYSIITHDIFSKGK